MADYKLASPHLRVLRGSIEAPEVLELQCLNPDLVAFDRTRVKHKWPTPSDAPFVFLTFVAWHAARREGAIPTDLTYEGWEATTLDVQNMAEEEDDDATADPTRGALEPD
jgi:hypothetical protein